MIKVNHIEDLMFSHNEACCPPLTFSLVASAWFEFSLHGMAVSSWNYVLMRMNGRKWKWPIPARLLTCHLNRVLVQPFPGSRAPWSRLTSSATLLLVQLTWRTNVPLITSQIFRWSGAKCQTVKHHFVQIKPPMSPYKFQWKTSAEKTQQRMSTRVEHNLTIFTWAVTALFEPTKGYISWLNGEKGVSPATHHILQNHPSTD